MIIWSRGLTDGHFNHEAEIRRLSRWPAVAIVVFFAGTEFSMPPRRRIAPNLLFAEYSNALDRGNVPLGGFGAG